MLRRLLSSQGGGLRARGILPCLMPEESTTPNLIKLTRSIWVAVNRQDWDAVLSFFAFDAFWDMSPMGLGTFEGATALRGLWEDWQSSYEEHVSEVEQALDLGQGVVFAMVRMQGRMTGSAGSVQARSGWVYRWVDGMVVRVTTYTDIDEARAAAESLAE